MLEVSPFVFGYLSQHPPPPLNLRGPKMSPVHHLCDHLHAGHRVMGLGKVMGFTTPKRLKIKAGWLEQGRAEGVNLGWQCDSPKALGAQRRARPRVLSPPRHHFSAGPFCPQNGRASSKACPRARLQEPKASVVGASRGCHGRAIPAVNLRGGGEEREVHRRGGQHCAVPRRCQHKVTFQMPGHIFFSFALELSVMNLRSYYSRFGVFPPYSSRLGVSPLVFPLIGPPASSSLQQRLVTLLLVTFICKTLVAFISPGAALDTQPMHGTQLEWHQVGQLEEIRPPGYQDCVLPHFARY